MIDELAPHQAALARMLGRSVPPGPADGLRAGWLTELRADPSRAIEGLRITIGEHSGQARQSKMLADLAMRFSENHDAATPDPEQIWRACGADASPVRFTRDGREMNVPRVPVKGAQPIRRLCEEHRQLFGQGQLQANLGPSDGSGGGCQFPVRQRPDPDRWCDVCGALDDLVPGVDGPDRPEVVCRDEDFCAANRERRYPPDPARAPQWIYQAQARLTDEQSRQMILAACGAALEDYIALMQPQDEELELAGQQQPFYGAYNQRGDWLTYQPQLNVNFAHLAWHQRHGHTLRNPANRTHLIDSQLSPARVAVMARVSQARAQAASGGGQDGGGQQPGRREIPETGIPEGVRQALDGDYAGGDIPTAPASAAVPQRPPRDKYGNRRGRKAAFPRRTLKYSGR